MCCGRGVRLTLGYTSSLPYVLEIGPFEKLPVLCRPVQERGHHAPRLSLSFAIRKELAEFRRVALKEGLVNVRGISHTICFFELAGLALGHLNKICSLHPGRVWPVNGFTRRKGSP